MEIQMLITGRRWGKQARLREQVAEAEAAGHWVVVAGPSGTRCSRCHRLAELCTGSCMIAVDLDDQTSATRDQLICQLARELDLSPELLGAGSMNHWSAWRGDDA